MVGFIKIFERFSYLEPIFNLCDFASSSIRRSVMVHSNNR